MGNSGWLMYKTSKKLFEHALIFSGMGKELFFESFVHIQHLIYHRQEVAENIYF
jgi:hypothetical protein